MLYFLKNAIKLNHEFLADQMVLQKGYQTLQYQKTLLAYSSNAQYNQLANAINYSSIKKRLTIMKTETTTKTKWIKTILIAPLFSLLLFSFSSAKEVQVAETVTPVLKITKNPTTYSLNGKITTLEKLKSDFIKITNKKEADLRIDTTDEINMNLISEIRNQLTPYIRIIKISSGVVIDGTNYLNSATQQKATPAQIAEYNVLAKKYNAIPGNNIAIKLKDVQRLRYLYRLMTSKQKANAQPFPNFPPTPPSPKVLNGEKSNIPPPPPSPIISSFNGIKCDGNVLKFTTNEIKKGIVSVKNHKVTSFNIKFSKKPTVRVNGNVLNEVAKEYLEEYPTDKIIQIFNIKIGEDFITATPIIFKIKE